MKTAIYKYFDVNTTAELKKSDRFNLAITSTPNINLKKAETWSTLYRNLIGIIPGETSEEGYGVVNGVNIFENSGAWSIFGLDGATAKLHDVKSTYRELCKFYHPDTKETGDAKMFDRIHTLYKSLLLSFQNN